ncbi:HAMP domain-containing sensor histidine kinase [Caulifigura coniformis]|nr:ATP-binding protein [Caulifigura coniformis]
MTRLFIRFYVSVILILSVAMCVMAFAFRYRIDTDISGVAEKAMRGGIRQVRQSIRNSPAANDPALFDSLQRQLGFPVQQLSTEETSLIVGEWLQKKDDVIVHAGHQLAVFMPLDDGANSLRLGPVPAHDGTIETDMIVAIGAVLLLVAVAIAAVLRPLAKQLSIMEQTAVSIADGNLAARVDITKASSAATFAHAFNDMAARTETLLRTQQELLQAVSHELRTPLSRIGFAIDLLRTSRNDDEREQRLTSLETASQELNGMVGELLQYVRLETGSPQLVKESVALRPLVDDLIEKASLTNRAIRFQIGPQLASSESDITADSSGLVRVLGNLLANASRFGRHTVVVNAVSSAAGTTIDVDDDGPGIPDAERERVFEPFVRLNEDHPGAGLGLALVKRILTNHGGTAAVLKSPLGGCRIRTVWPKS